MYPTHTMMLALSQAQLDELHDRARRTSQIRDARHTRRTRGQQTRNRAPKALAAVTSWARRRRPAPESP
jgi:hypothetical protein